MTSKERVFAAMNHEEPDRVPIDIYPRDEIREQLVDHFSTEDFLPYLGVDFRSVRPEYIGAGRPVPEGCEGVDEWGIGWRTVWSGKYSNSENVYLPFAQLATLEDVESYDWPTADKYDYSTIEEQCDGYAEYAVCAGDWGMPDINNGTSFARGMETVMCDIMLRDPVGVAIIDKRLDLLYDRWMRVLEAAKGKVDVLVLGEDCGHMTGLMYPPGTYQDFFRPRTQRFIDLGHDFGCKCLMHCCGHSVELIPTFIQMGLDALMVQPEPVGMDLERLKREFGDKIAFVGGVSVQRTLPLGTVEECREEARHLIGAMGKGGGYIFAPSNLIQPDTPLENVLAMYEVAQGLEPGALS